MTLKFFFNSRSDILRRYYKYVKKKKKHSIFANDIIGLYLYHDKTILNICLRWSTGHFTKRSRKCKKEEKRSILRSAHDIMGVTLPRFSRFFFKFTTKHLKKILRGCNKKEKYSNFAHDIIGITLPKNRTLFKMFFFLNSLPGILRRYYEDVTKKKSIQFLQRTSLNLSLSHDKTILKMFFLKKKSIQF